MLKFKKMLALVLTFVFFLSLGSIHTYANDDVEETFNDLFSAYNNDALPIIYVDANFEYRHSDPEERTPAHYVDWAFNTPHVAFATNGVRIDSTLYFSGTLRLNANGTVEGVGPPRLRVEPNLFPMQLGTATNVNARYSILPGGAVDVLGTFNLSATSPGGGWLSIPTQSFGPFRLGRPIARSNEELNPIIDKELNLIFNEEIGHLIASGNFDEAISKAAEMGWILTLSDVEEAPGERDDVQILRVRAEHTLMGVNGHTEHRINGVWTRTGAARANIRVVAEGVLSFHLSGEIRSLTGNPPSITLFTTVTYADGADTELINSFTNTFEIGSRAWSPQNNGRQMWVSGTGTAIPANVGAQFRTSFHVSYHFRIA